LEEVLKFAHIADTHIRNLKYHKQYKEVFESLYNSLREEEIDYIIHCGDIAHTKTQLSPEFVDLCSDFLRNLASIAPTYVILGNHDGNLRNSNRQDALTPIVNALGMSDLHLLKDSGEIDLGENFAINVLSVFDADNWSKPNKVDKVNIALYHGSISNCSTDVGWIMEHGENDISIFDDFDYAFLGDIHKTNQPMDKEGRVRYCGSTIQQNHGESNDKGYLLWNIQDKETFDVKHICLPNPKPFITITLTKTGRLPKKTHVVEGARLRLVSKNSLPLDVIRKAVDVVKHRFKPEAVTYLNKSTASCQSDEESSPFLKENMRDLQVQEKLIREYLTEDFHIDEETMSSVLSLNKKFNTMVEEEEEVRRNVNWKLRKLEWDNLFNYGEGNSIDFLRLEGVTGILGKNFSGKSSIIDSLLYTLFNTSSKNNRKTYNMINQNKKNCRGYVEIDIGSKTFIIERSSEKYVKSLKGKTTNEAKTDVNFWSVDNLTKEKKELNGLSRNDTDRNIRKVFGTIDDFLLTSMASQLGSLSYISEGSTKRKEILAKFLDLEIFDKKFRLAKDEVVNLKGFLKQSRERDFDAEIKKARTILARNEASASLKERNCANLKKVIQEKVAFLTETCNKIDSIPNEIIEIENVKRNIADLVNKISILESDNKGFKKDINDNKGFIKKAEEFLENFDIENLNNKLEKVDSERKVFDELKEAMLFLDTEIQNQNKKIKLLDEVPCGDKFPKCKFISDAHSTKEVLNKNLIKIEDLSMAVDHKSKKLSLMESDKLNEYLKKYNQLLGKKTETENENNQLELNIAKGKNSIILMKNKKEKLIQLEKEYEENKEAIENLENLLKQKSDLTKQKKESEKDHDKCHKELLELYKKNGSLEQKLVQIEKDKMDYLEKQEEFSAYDLFLRCMHANGIAYSIIKNRLPVLNEEISKILANIVDFEVMFENDENKLYISIKHSKHEPRPIELGSGAEKTICAMAIRLALLNVSTLPKGDIFILDEPGTSLDEENMEGFINIIDMIKDQFKTVLLISHLDGLKDIVDLQIEIDKSKGFAYVNK